MKFLLWIVQFGVGLIAYFRASKDRELGRLEEREKNANEAMDDISKANAVRDHYNRDPAYRERVQERFKRKE